MSYPEASAGRAWRYNYLFFSGAEQFQRLVKRRSGERAESRARLQPQPNATAGSGGGANFILYLCAQCLTGSLPRYLPKLGPGGKGRREAERGAPAGRSAGAGTSAGSAPAAAAASGRSPVPTLYLPRAPRAGPPRHPWRLIGRGPTNRPSPRAGGMHMYSPAAYS